MRKLSRVQRWTLLFTILAVVVVLVFIGGWVLSVEPGTISVDVFLRILTRRSSLVLAMIIGAVLVTVASLVFQTLTQNRILTPSLMGFDAVYVATQTFIVFTLGTIHPLFTDDILNFILSTVVMVGVSSLMYVSLLRRHRSELGLLLLLGLVISSMLRSSTSFLATLMNPDEFQSVVAATAVSLTNIATPLLVVALPVMVILIVSLMVQHPQLDVMTLGRSQAIGLGLPYDEVVKRNIILISIAMAIATALIGPMVFLGLIAVNASREITRTHRHTHLFVISSLLAIIFLVGGQLLVEWLGFVTTVTVVINLIGGIYVVGLILKENRA